MTSTPRPFDLAALDIAGTTLDEGGLVYEVLDATVADTVGQPLPKDLLARWKGTSKREAITGLLAELDADASEPAVDKVFAEFEPKLSEASRAAETLFLANIHPDLQRAVHEQCPEARFVAMDTMNFWIEGTRRSLEETIAGVDCLIVNDEEVKQLTDEPNLVRAARAVHEMGPRVVIAKQGEHGAGMYTPEGFFALPAYPTADVVDPTGAGDTFAGGFMGYVAAHADEEISDELLRRAMAYGTALASFNVEAFGTERMQALTGEEITARVRELQRISAFEPAPLELRA
jgi:cytidine kinase